MFIIISLVNAAKQKGLQGESDYIQTPGESFEKFDDRRGGKSYDYPIHVLKGC